MDHHFIKDRDIVLFSFQPWESEIGFNFKDMAYELAKFNRVLFVNRALDRASLMPDKIAGLTVENKVKEQLVKIADNFWLYDTGLILESINWIGWPWLYNACNRINNKRLARKINQQISALSFKKVIVINDNDFFRGLYLKTMVPSCKSYIFYIRDFLTIQPYFRKHGARLEKKVIKTSDFVVANSAYLANYARQWNSKSFDIGQGCDFAPYLKAQFPAPVDILNIPRPIIGYCGAITAMRLDAGIVEIIARSFPNYSIVLVGPADEYFENSDLSKYSNIYFLGGKSPAEVPNYIFQFDVCINPQLTNQLTIGNYPRKIDEYLAMGKPVVATATDGMMMFKKHVYLCSDKEDYIKMIHQVFANKEAFGEIEKQRRIEFALSHTWERSIGLLGDAYYNCS